MLHLMDDGTFAIDLRLCSADNWQEHPWVTKGGTDKLLSSEENCADLVEPPTEAEMDQAITGNMGNLMVVMKAAKRFKRLLKRAQFMDGFFGRESRMVAPPHTVHGHSKSADNQERRPLHEAVANQADGIDREVDEDILQADLGKPETPTPQSLDSTAVPEIHHEESEARQAQRRETETHHPPLSDFEGPDPDALQRRSRTFPLDEHATGYEHAKGHAHDPLEDRLFLRIGPGADVAESGDPMEEPIISESPGGVDDDIYEAAYQEVSTAISATMFVYSTYSGNQTHPRRTRRRSNRSHPPSRTHRAPSQASQRPGLFRQPRHVLRRQHRPPRRSPRAERWSRSPRSRCS